MGGGRISARDEHDVHMRVFLDSPAAASITGSDIVMDGGARLLSDKGEKYGFN